ncbi:MAG: hypothetical protein DHS20C05_12830 [Hyphococcus sp.]|nr:MAG: hypothetical protein DHS20C05_12830 [Marinicaulis sp.]
MKQILLIAWREYKQYIFSRGFLLFLTMFPLGLVFVGAAVGLLENNKPIRYFVVYDETGAYTDEIDQELDRRYMQSAIAAWDAYILVASGGAEVDIPAPFAPDDVNDARIVAFETAGGFEKAQSLAKANINSGLPSFVPPKRSFYRLPTPGDIQALGSLLEIEEAFRPYLLEQRLIGVPSGGGKPLFAAVLIPSGFGAGEDAAQAQYWSRNLTDQSLEMIIRSALNRALRRSVIADYGLPGEALDAVAAVDAPIASFRPDKAPEEAELGMKDRIETALPAGLTYMLLVIIFGVGNLLLTNTIEERSNKIVEILLSSVTANQLMMGKLLGIAAVGLTMPALFLSGGLALTLADAGSENVMAVAVTTLFSTNLIFVYLFYFFCAYLIFSMIFLAIGAVSNSLQDAQSYMGPVMLLVFAPLPFMVMVFQNPNGLVASILTWIPIYTPYAVMMRAASDPPLWEIVGATALMLAFTLFLMRIMGRIFRQAILQASPPKIRDVWRLTRKEKA